jgi:DNA repair protein RecO (recombination protein O)
VSHKLKDLEPAYILHTRAYRETSVIADFMTQHHGRVQGVVRGARGAKSKRKAMIQPFCPILVQWYGRGDLVTVSKIESCGKFSYLQGNSLICGLYVNELLQRLLPTWQAYEAVFIEYVMVIESLASSQVKLQQVLRRFEKRLLENLGYGVSLTQEAGGRDKIHSSSYYRYVEDEGWYKVQDVSNIDLAFSGSTLLAINANDFSDPLVCKQAKRLMRMMLLPLLGTKPLQSRLLLEA